MSKLYKCHGTSTILNDKIESAPSSGVQRPGRKVESELDKSMIGHLLAAAGAVEFISTVRSVGTGIIPPTINYQEPDPECPLDYVISGAESADIEVALSNSFGFGGGNACLAVKKFSEDT
jgi:3-oxoacyl-(acyl-carrier-protein) synthase